VEAGGSSSMFSMCCQHLMKYVYFEFGMSCLEVFLVLTFVLQGGIVGIIVSLEPHHSRSIGSGLDRVGIDEVMYFPAYFVFVFASPAI
jgi:hypothetical protein